MDRGRSIVPDQNLEEKLLTALQEKALHLAVDDFLHDMWEKIAERMLNHGCKAKWPKDDCKKKWAQMNPNDDCLASYEFPPQHHSDYWEPDEDLYSDEKASVCHSMPETAILDEARSRAASDASSQMFQMRQRNRQQQIMFEEVQRHNGWEEG